MPDVRIDRAIIVTPDEEQENPDEAAMRHCKVEGVIGREIRFELLLPDAWNGRFAMGGGGGFVGSIQNSARWTHRLGYATAGTDTGHQDEGTSAQWALNQPERQINFGHLAIHRTAETAKAIIRAYYESDVAYSYFLGCSRGGGQGLMEAQRYPADFDGIVAGAPAYDWTGIMAEGLQNLQRLYPDPFDVDTPIVSPEQLQFLDEAILAECDALDGVRDGVMEDPRTCPFTLSSLPRCTQANDEAPDSIDATCFTEAQVEALAEVHAPTGDDANPLYAGFPFGGEGHPWGWMNWITGRFDDLYRNSGGTTPSLVWAFSTNFARYIVFGDPDWDYRTFDASSWEEQTTFASAFMDATDPDLSDFSREGSKLIVWHGWSDAALSALGSIAYFEDAERLDPDVRDHFRLFMMPGVLHCGGGPGPDEVHWLEVLTDWVEHDQPPDRVVALRRDENGQAIRSRPLCPYPQRAVYDGSGDPDDADSFACRAP